jgi:hypothetical protein
VQQNQQKTATGIDPSADLFAEDHMMLDTSGLELERFVASAKLI